MLDACVHACKAENRKKIKTLRKRNKKREKNQEVGIRIRNNPANPPCFPKELTKIIFPSDCRTS